MGAAVKKLILQPVKNSSQVLTGDRRWDSHGYLPPFRLKCPRNKKRKHGRNKEGEMGIIAWNKKEKGPQFIEIHVGENYAAVRGPGRIQIGKFTIR